MHNRTRVASHASMRVRSGSHLHNYIYQHFHSDHLHEKFKREAGGSVHASCPSINHLALAVFAAFGLLVAAPSVVDPVSAADWDGSQESVLKIEAPKLDDVHTVVKGVTSGDRYDLDSANHNWLWTTQDSEDPTLQISVNGIVTGTQSGGNFSDPWSSTNALWLTASLKTILASSSYSSQDYTNLAEATSAGSEYSSTTNNSSVILNFEKNSGILAKVYGARNDLGGGLSLESYDQNAGNANDNSVLVNLAEGSRFYAKLVFGGRSSQLDGISTNDSGTNVVHAGFETDRNSVQINGNISDGAARTLDPNNTSLGLTITKGIFGAEGYQTNNNRVELRDVAVVAGMSGARKLGLVGGRGLYYLRINSNKDGEYKEVVQGSLGYYEGDEVKRTSAIANNNVVTIKNSYVGYYVDKANNHMSWADYPSEEGSGVGFSVYGGWSTGVAMNNIVAAEDSVINGNVIGGLEFQDQLKVQKDADGNPLFRDLHANLVSLKDTRIKAGSIYGSTTAEGELSSASSYANTNSLDEGTTRAVNRRRGVAYIAGDVAADSAYVRYISFGQYLDTSLLDNEKNYEVFQTYYPKDGSAVEEFTVLDKNDPLEQATVRLTDGAAGSIQLGTQVAGSYLINRNGYHSSLTATDPYDEVTKKGSQSTVTNGLHNFWVGAYANLSDGVSGDGTSFNTKVKLFNENGNVNHTYTGGDLSLLTHDDGMWYSYDKSVGGESSNHRPALMHFYRYHYEGLVLYLGVNDGSGTTPAVQISFDKIAEFRNGQNQDTNAFGNTFVGIIKDGIVYQKASVEDGNNSVNASDMTFEVPFTVQQTVEGEKVDVAKATYAFYKYLHFDGKDGTLEDGSIGKITDQGQEAGVGLKYWLKSLEINEGRDLVLNGKLEGSELVVEDFQSEDPSPKPVQELYTLSAELTGSGNVVIAPNSTVVIGNPSTIYNIDVEEGGVVR